MRWRMTTRRIRRWTRPRRHCCAASTASCGRSRAPSTRAPSPLCRPRPAPARGRGDPATNNDDAAADSAKAPWAAKAAALAVGAPWVLRRDLRATSAPSCWRRARPSAAAAAAATAAAADPTSGSAGSVETWDDVAALMVSSQPQGGIGAGVAAVDGASVERYYTACFLPLCEALVDVPNPKSSGSSSGSSSGGGGGAYFPDALRASAATFRRRRVALRFLKCQQLRRACRWLERRPPSPGVVPARGAPRHRRLHPPLPRRHGGARGFGQRKGRGEQAGRFGSAKAVAMAAYVKAEQQLSLHFPRRHGRSTDSMPLWWCPGCTTRRSSRHRRPRASSPPRAASAPRRAASGGGEQPDGGARGGEAHPARLLREPPQPRRARPLR